LEKGKIIDHNSYVDEALKTLGNELEEENPKFGCQGLILAHENSHPILIKASTTFLKVISL
jgi:hypothetical protein